MSEQFATFLLIFICAVCIGICQLNSKESTKTARRFWYSAIASQVGGLLLGMTAMTNLDSTLKNRDITLLTMVHLVKAMVFPVVMYGCESWPMKKAECQRINASELGSWRRLLRAPWTTRRSNQSVNPNANQS